ncbi:homocysteine S-methyltransferase family protein [Aquibium sp. LZ166]|uniref:Homocysteine S-methyltransferase family protein n=1 Tax=Aquibium pacificus TaxID=3153579 RepID=A0ABV3SLW9_9HYPH
MSKYRNNLPQTKGGMFLTDGGLETTLIFKEGIDLPAFASFVLLETDRGREKLTAYYENYLSLARARGVGFILDTPTWRANPDWGRELGYDADGLRRINQAGVRFVEGLRRNWETPATPVVLNGVIGPRGDGYKAGRVDPDEAQDYHAFQLGILADTAADMISAITMNAVNEAIGIARAAKAAGMPSVISFTVETDGRLADGASLREAVERTDEATGGAPAYYMINCAHPSHFEAALQAGEQWLERVQGLRANASAKSHAELDESTELDEGDIPDLGRRYSSLTARHPQMRILGGCCGTDHTHIRAICEACLPAEAA